MYWFTHRSPNPLFYRCKFFRPYKTIHFFKKLERKQAILRDTGGSRRRQNWKKTCPFSLCKFKSVFILASLCKTIHFSKVYWFTHGSPNPLFYRCKFWPRLRIRLLFRKTAATIAATERHWRLRSSPIVENKTVVSLRKLKSVLIYTWIAKPFILPLQIFLQW